MLLDITIDGNLLYVIIFIIVILFAMLGNKFYKANDKSIELTKQLEAKEIIRQNDQRVFFEKELQYRTQMNELAQKEFEKFKAVELDSYKKIADKMSHDAALVMLQQWIMENNDRIRKDAANRSVRIVMGKVTEHLIPFSEAFGQFNPKDARFIGSPIDLIVFDGVEDKKDEITIYFLEIKTGTSALSSRQRKVMEAIKSKRVEWLRLSIKDFGDEVNDTL